MDYRLSVVDGHVGLFQGDEPLGEFSSKLQAVDAVVGRMLAPDYHEYPAEFYEAASLSDRAFTVSSFQRNQLYRLQAEARIRKSSRFRQDLERVVARGLKDDRSEPGVDAGL